MRSSTVIERSSSSPPAVSPAIRLCRRIGLGLRASDIGLVAVDDPAAIAARLLSDETGLAAANGVDDPPGDPWGDADYTVVPDGADGSRRGVARGAILAWIDGLVASETPVVDWLAWFWHGHFVSSLVEVKNPQFMVDQIRLFRRRGVGPFGQLARDVTVDAAMLLYLDGNGSTGASPNENYSRELLELFTLGRGSYTEDDIAAGARALSGWVLRRNDLVPRFVPSKHEPAPQHYLDQDGVSDVDTVVAAIESNPAVAGFVTQALAAEIVGPSVPADVIERAAFAFRDSGLSIAALVRALIDEVVGGVDGGDLVSSPLLWFVAARRITDARPPDGAVLLELQAAGQVPWLAPNVSGWPSGTAWNNAAALVARFNLAALIAANTDTDHPTRQAASVDELANALGLGPFGDATRAALERLDASVDRLTLALVAPEFVLC